MAASALAVGTGFALDRVAGLGDGEQGRSVAGSARPGPADPADRRPATDRTGPASPGVPADPPAADPPPTSPAPLKRVRAPRKSDPRPDTTKRPPGSSPSGPGGASSTGGSPLESAVIQITNRERAGAGCPALRSDAKLAVAARRHSADMAAKNYFSHDSQDGRSFADRIKAAGYPSPGAENIAKGHPTAAAVMEGWMNSPGHRANILNCKLRAIGVGVKGGSGGLVWTQDFGFS